MPTKAAEFEIVRVDGWGNTVVRCPVCDGEFKGDGIRKHILQQCKAEQREAGLCTKGHCEYKPVAVVV